MAQLRRHSNPYQRSGLGDASSRRDCQTRQSHHRGAGAIADPIWLTKTPFDVLVNNAGVYAFAPLEEVTEDEFHREFNINVLGVLLASREAMKYFGPGGGSVINISSIASTSPTPTAVVYSATKGAVDTITRVLATELGPKKIRVNAINPGGVETEGVHSMGVIGSEFEKRMVARTPLGRLGQPDDIASVAVFLASEASGWMTGETIAVGGGYS